MTNIHRMRASLVAMAPLFTCLSATSHAVTLRLDRIYSDTPVPPAAASPWLTVVTTDLGANQVKVDLEAVGLTGSEYASEWYLNLDPALDPTKLSFISSDPAPANFLLPTIALGINAYKADGDGFYDIRLNFDSSGGNNHRFTASDKLTYTVTYNGAGVFAGSSLAFLSAPDGGVGPFYAAAHVQSTGGDGLGSVYIAAVPEPSTAVYGAIAALTLFAGGRKRRRTGD